MKTLILAIVAVFTALCSLNTDSALKAEFQQKGDISGYAETVTFDRELPDFYADENGDFTVLQFTDTHFTTMTSLNDRFLLQKMKSQTEKYDPDLVVVTGDMIDDGNDGKFNKAYVLRTVAEAFEEMDQYWAYVPGNNDGINYGTSEDVVAYLSQYEHCLVSDVPEISGGCQYSLDIYDESELIHSMLFIDTMDYDNDDPDHTYGYVHADQVQWCDDEIDSKKAENDNVTVSVFLHENTPDFFRAAKKGEKYKWYYPEVTSQLEKYNIPKNQPLDDVFRNSGCVGLLSMGHKHPAAAECSFYNGIYYHVTPQTVLASTLITIHTGEDNVREMYDFESVYC
ncbi:MAG: metallophosphoesterase [Clostridia bacterium]|nr:metallophosphoesterase [Clostridia bacterium]